LQKEANMQTVNIHDAKTQLSRYLDQAAAGEGIIIARAGRPVARLLPLDRPKQARQLGLGKAQYSLPPNFDDLHGAEIEAMFEGR
jgi:prevent-host-death family protein